MDRSAIVIPSILFMWVFFIFSFNFIRYVKGELDGICELKGCKCLDITGGWKKANCTFGPDQDVTFGKDSIHRKIEEIFIVGGHLLSFEEKSSNALNALYILEINNAKEIILKKHSFYNSSSASLRFKVENCDSLIIENEAFVNSNSTEFIELNKARYCVIFSAAFSKLLNATFQNINRLDLFERTFEIKNKNDIFRHHGTATTIIFNKVKIPKIPSETFFSPLAEIRIQDCEIKEIHPKAFSAVQITSINLKNSVIDTIRNDACSNKSLILDLNINKCNISKIETNAFICAITILNVLYSRIKMIETGSVNTTAANINIIGNEIINFENSALVLYSWNRIQIEQNIIKNLGKNAISGKPDENSENFAQFSFINNDIFHPEISTLSIISRMNPGVKIKIRDNFFHIKCHCYLNETLETFTRTTNNIEEIMNTSFCEVDDLLARCYELKTGSINMMNFTELVCSPGDQIKCEHYNGETVNITNPVFFNSPQDEDNSNHSWLILIMTCVGLVVISVVATLIFLLISGGRWLKRKGYLFRNIHYNPNNSNNETSNDEETIVTLDMDSSDKFVEIPEELTLEYLELLKKRLDDPNTHQETSEMIERLYEMFIIEDNYDNNNRNNENNDEAHLYEELSAMQQQQQPSRMRNTKSFENLEDGPLGILKLMEERFNLQYIDNVIAENNEQQQNFNVDINEYSEPSDAAVHLYSELRNCENSMKKRPLPDKPGPSSTPD